MSWYSSAVCCFQNHFVRIFIVNIIVNSFAFVFVNIRSSILNSIISGYSIIFVYVFIFSCELISTADNLNFLTGKDNSLHSGH